MLEIWVGATCITVRKMLTDCSSLTTQLSSEGTIGSSAPSSGAASLARKDSSTGASVCCFSRCVFIASARELLLLHNSTSPSRGLQQTNTSTRKEDRIRSRRGRCGYHEATGPRRGAAPARSGRKPGAGRGGERAGPGLADNAAGRGEAEATAMLAPASPCGFWEVRGSGNGDVRRAARECGTARRGTAASGAEGEGGRRGVAGLGYIRGAGRCFPCFVATRTAEGTGCLLAGGSRGSTEEARHGGCGGRDG